MLIGAMIVALVGALCVVLGWLIWKKEKITLLHDYHYQYVSEKDKKAFCTAIGVGILMIGAGLLATAVLLVITDSVWSFILMTVGFAAGLVLLIHAGNQYNKKPKK